MAPPKLDSKCGFNIAKGLVSIVVLICGVTFICIVNCLVRKLIINAINDGIKNMYPDYQDKVELYERYNHHWAFGSAFFITGITGLITSCVQKRGAYITHMVFGIVALGVNGAVFIYVLCIYEEVKVLKADDAHCPDDACLCGGSVSTVMVTILVFVVIGWILTLVTVVISGILACKKEANPGMEVPSPCTSTDAQLSPVMSFQTGCLPQTGYLPQTHDHAILVSNMECQQGVYGK